MKRLFLIAVIVVISLVVGYRSFLTFAANSVVKHVHENVLTEDVISEMMADPTIATLIDEIETEKYTLASSEQLPFTTKEEGLKVVIGKFSTSEIKQIINKAQKGLTEEEQIELVETYKDRFSEEEWQALLYVGLSELKELSDTREIKGVELEGFNLDK